MRRLINFVKEEPEETLAVSVVSALLIVVLGAWIGSCSSGHRQKSVQQVTQTKAGEQTPDEAQRVTELVGRLSALDLMIEGQQENERARRHADKARFWVHQWVLLHVATDGPFLTNRNGAERRWSPEVNIAILKAVENEVNAGQSALQR